MKPEQPIFLERESYRRRRLGDAARLLPIVGAVLFMLPILWAGTGATARGVIYLFVVWAILILVMAILSRRLSDTEPKSEGSKSGADDAV